MDRSYFSDRETGSRARINEVISDTVWQGIEAYINTLIDTGAFGNKCPEHCQDRHVPIGTNRQNFTALLNAEIPNIQWSVDNSTLPLTLDILDLVEFCFDAVAEPIKDNYHKFFNHYHLTFDVEQGKRKFSKEINRLFARNGLVFELKEDGDIERIAPPILREALNVSTFSTGEDTLDRLLETARAKYLDPDIVIRRESLEKLWDAWERLKTIEIPSDKKASVEAVLDGVTKLPEFRKLIGEDARILTGAGNNLMIRHTEIGKEYIDTSEEVDYLFHRLYALIHLILANRSAV